MAAPAFGFSFGDFVAGTRLVKDLIKALDDSAGAKLAYRCLVSDLRSLDGALARVHALEIDERQVSQKVALEQVAAQCQESIQKFLKKNSKFQNTLGLGLDGNSTGPGRWKLRSHKIQWALFKDDDIDALKAEIKAHTTTINLIMNTIQL